MEYAREFIDIACPHDAAMALFGDPMRLHEWAVAWCQGVEETPDGYVATTVEGPRCFDVRVDHATGVADVCAGASHDLLNDILHVRAIPAGPDRTLVHFVYAPPGDVPPEVLELMRTGLTAEARRAKELLERASSAA